MMLGGMVGEPREVPLPPLPEAYWTSDHRTFVPRYLNADLAELVGYFMGDGSLHARGLRFCVHGGDDDVVDRIVELGRRLFGLEAAVAPKTGYTEVALHSVRLTLWWEACGFAKHAPNGEHRGKGYEAAHPGRGPLHERCRRYRAFVRGLFEADGNVNNGYASFSTVSDRFSREVQTLLLALGFVTTRKVDQPTRRPQGRQPHPRPAAPQRQRGRPVPRRDLVHLRAEAVGAGPARSSDWRAGPSASASRSSTRNTSLTSSPPSAPAMLSRSRLKS